MSGLNIDQVFSINPITVNADTDLMYFGQSPYVPGDDAAMTFANFKAQFPGKTGTGASGTWGISISGNAATATSASSASSVPVGGITGLGTGVATALAINVGSAGAFVTFNGAGGTPSSMVGTNITGTAAGLTAGSATTASSVALGGITGLGTGVATALAINVGSAGAPVLFNGAGGTPSSMVGTNITGTAAGLTAGTASAVPVGGITGLGANVAATLAIALGSANAMLTRSKIIGQSYNLTTASGSLAFTGAGFKPRFLILMCADNGGGPTISVGMWDGSSGFGMGNYSASSAAVTGFSSTTSWQLLGSLNNTNYVTMAVASLDSDGFTLTMTKTGSPTGTVNIYAMCVQ